MNLTYEQMQEINEQRNALHYTARPTVQALENLLYIATPVLDHGFIRVVDYMGDEAAIVQAARVSYGKGTKAANEDRGLIRYLMRHRHSTPFEMCEIKFHVKLPIFVARQWVRHRTANINEYSARYSIMDKEFYVPDIEHMAAQSKANHQGRGDVLTHEQAIAVQRLLREDAEQAYNHYETLLDREDDTSSPWYPRPSGQVAPSTTLDSDPTYPGLARELARMNLSLNFYTQWYWKIDLHNLMGFLSLRADSHAQYEIRAYAEPMLAILKAWQPNVHEAFQDYRMDARTFSGPMMRALLHMLRNPSTQEPDFASFGLSKREWHDMQTMLVGS